MGGYVEAPGGEVEVEVEVAAEMPCSEVDAGKTEPSLLGEGDDDDAEGESEWDARVRALLGKAAAPPPLPPTIARAPATVAITGAASTGVPSTVETLERTELNAQIQHESIPSSSGQEDIGGGGGGGEVEGGSGDDGDGRRGNGEEGGGGGGEATEASSSLDLAFRWFGLAGGQGGVDAGGGKESGDEQEENIEEEEEEEEEGQEEEEEEEHEEDPLAEAEAVERELLSSGKGSSDDSRSSGDAVAEALDALAPFTAWPDR